MPEITAEQGVILYFLFNCLVQAFPEPKDTHWGDWYKIVFSFLHLIAGNVALIKKTFKAT